MRTTLWKDGDGATLAQLIVDFVEDLALIKSLEDSVFELAAFLIVVKLNARLFEKNFFVRLDSLDNLILDLFLVLDLGDVDAVSDFELGSEFCADAHHRLFILKLDHA